MEAMTSKFEHCSSKPKIDSEVLIFIFGKFSLSYRCHIKNRLVFVKDLILCLRQSSKSSDVDDKITMFWEI